MSLPAAELDVKQDVDFERQSFRSRGQKSSQKNYKDFLALSRNLRSAAVEHAIDVTDPVLSAVARELASIKDCGNTVLRGSCTGGHEVAKVLRCGREWCPRCGQLDSEAHMRRYSRILPKVQQIQSMGFFVIQFPVASRPKYRTRKALSRVGTKLVRWFKRHGFDRGIRAWDYFGDPRCPVHHVPGEHQRLAGDRDGKKWDAGDYRCRYGCVFTLLDVHPEDMQYNPHLNILVEAGHLANLESLKAGLRHVLREPNLIVRYRYGDAIPTKLHFARYAVKPTFHNVGWDFEMVAELAGFRSVWTWGHWNEDPLWELNSTEESKKLAPVVALEQGHCMDCGTDIHWSGVWSLRKLVPLYRLEDLGAGYYRLVSRRE